MVDQEFFDDQTIFAEEEPLLERQRKKTTLTAKTVNKPSPFILLGGFLLIVLLIGGITMMFTRGRNNKPLTTITPTPSPKVQTTSELDQLFSELKMSVQKADPLNNSMTFPPISYEITISDEN